MAKDKKEAKKNAVVARLMDLHASNYVLAGMWDERTLDVLILALGLGHIELD